MAANLEGLMAYGEYGTETNEDQLNLCLEAAKEWFEKAGVPKSMKGSLYEMGVYRLATFYQERRGLVDSGCATDAVPQGIQGIVHQLRSWGG